jgi:hypothetical protein
MKTQTTNSLKEFHPYWLALIEWARAHPYSKVTIEFREGIPVHGSQPLESISFNKLAESIVISDSQGKGGKQ